MEVESLPVGVTDLDFGDGKRGSPPPSSHHFIAENIEILEKSVEKMENEFKISSVPIQ